MPSKYLTVDLKLTHITTGTDTDDPGVAAYQQGTLLTVECNSHPYFFEIGLTEAMRDRLADLKLIPPVSDEDARIGAVPIDAKDVAESWVTEAPHNLYASGDSDPLTHVPAKRYAYFCLEWANNDRASAL